MMDLVDVPDSSIPMDKVRDSFQMGNYEGALNLMVMMASSSGSPQESSNGSSPHDLSLAMNKAICLFHLNKLEESLFHVNHVLYQVPGESHLLNRCHLIKAKVLTGLGRDSEAEDSYSKALGGSSSGPNSKCSSTSPSSSPPSSTSPDLDQKASPPSSKIISSNESNHGGQMTAEQNDAIMMMVVNSWTGMKPPVSSVSNNGTISGDSGHSSPSSETPGESKVPSTNISSSNGSAAPSASASNSMFGHLTSTLNSSSMEFDFSSFWPLNFGPNDLMALNLQHSMNGPIKQQQHHQAQHHEQQQQQQQQNNLSMSSPNGQHSSMSNGPSSKGASSPWLVANGHHNNSLLPPSTSNGNTFDLNLGFGAASNKLVASAMDAMSSNHQHNNSNQNWPRTPTLSSNGFGNIGGHKVSNPSNSIPSSSQGQHHNHNHPQFPPQTSNGDSSSLLYRASSDQNPWASLQSIWSSVPSHSQQQQQQQQQPQQHQHQTQQQQHHLHNSNGHSVNHQHMSHLSHQNVMAVNGNKVGQTRSISNNSPSGVRSNWHQPAGLARPNASNNLMEMGNWGSLANYPTAATVEKNDSWNQSIGLNVPSYGGHRQPSQQNSPYGISNGHHHLQTQQQQPQQQQQQQLPSSISNNGHHSQQMNGHHSQQMNGHHHHHQSGHGSGDGLSYFYNHNRNGQGSSSNSSTCSGSDLMSGSIASPVNRVNNILRFKAVYVDNVHPQIDQIALTELFAHFGSLVSVEVKPVLGNVPTFACIEYADHEGPENAVTEAINNPMHQEGINFNLKAPLSVKFTPGVQERKELLSGSQARNWSKHVIERSGECFEWRFSSSCSMGKNCPRKHAVKHRQIDTLKSFTL